MSPDEVLDQAAPENFQESTFSQTYFPVDLSFTAQPPKSLSAVFGTVTSYDDPGVTTATELASQPTRLAFETPHLSQGGLLLDFGRPWAGTNRRTPPPSGRGLCRGRDLLLTRGGGDGTQEKKSGHFLKILEGWHTCIPHRVVQTE